MGQAADPSATARQAFDLLLGGKYAELYRMLTPDLQRSYPETALAKLAEQAKNHGALSTVDPPAVQKMGANTIVVLPAHFEKQNINFRYIINAAGMISGMFQLPGEVSWQRPEYSKPGTFQERAVTVGEGEWKLPGTLLVPVGNGPFPGVVLVQGWEPRIAMRPSWAARRCFETWRRALHPEASRRSVMRSGPSNTRPAPRDCAV